MRKHRWKFVHCPKDELLVFQGLNNVLECISTCVYIPSCVYISSYICISSLFAILKGTFYLGTKGVYDNIDR